MTDALTRVLRAWPLLVLLVLAGVFTLMLTFSRKAPVIASLEPAMAAPGETVVLTGDYFGRTPREGTLSLSGEIPPPSLVRSWSDQKIVFDIPEDATSGLVTVSNTQGTSQGILFTNTESIPTVLQNAAAPGQPLIAAVLPSHPVSGQTVTVTGRGFGSGAETVALRLETGGPLLELSADRSLVLWTERTISFVLPAGVGADSTLRVSTPRGESAPYALQATTPLTFGESRTVTIEFHAQVTSTRSVVVWGPVPRAPGTKWTADAPTSASWEAGAHDLRYRLTLTSWSKAAAAPASAPTPPAPPVDVSLSDSWKPAAAALKTLTAGWGLDTGDGWQKLQKLQTGLNTFTRSVGPRERPALSADASALLASRTLNSFETSTLAVYLASQAGLSVRLVTGLWLDDDGSPRTRTWTEAWLPGGWIPWDPVDGNPGRLDNKHYAFATTLSAPERRLPRSVTWGRPAPATLGDPTGEVASRASSGDAEPVVLWEFTRVDK